MLIDNLSVLEIVNKKVYSLHGFLICIPMVNFNPFCHKFE